MRTSRLIIAANVQLLIPGLVFPTLIYYADSRASES